MKIAPKNVKLCPTCPDMTNDAENLPNFTMKTNDASLAKKSTINEVKKKVKSKYKLF